MQTLMTPGMYHNGRPFPVVFSDEMRLKPRFGCNFLSTYRATPFLVLPDFDELFPSFGAVQHSFSVTFLIISRPSFIEWVGFGGDFPESDDFSVCRVFQFEVFFIEVFTAESRLRCKRPRPVINDHSLRLGITEHVLSRTINSPLIRTFIGGICIPAARDFTLWSREVTAYFPIARRDI